MKNVMLVAVFMFFSSWLYAIPSSCVGMDDICTYPTDDLGYQVGASFTDFINMNHVENSVMYKDAFKSENTIDVSACLQCAIDWTSSKNQVLYIDNGYFSLDNPINLKSNTAIYGRSGVLLFRKTNCSNNGLFQNNTASVLEAIVIDSVKFVNIGEDNNPDYNCYAIYNSSASGGFTRSKFIHNDIFGFERGISVSGSGDYLDYYILSEIESTSEFYAGNIIKNNYIHNEGVEPTSSGAIPAIYARDGYFVIDGNRIENMQTGILGASHSVISNNIIIGAKGDNGIYLSGAKHSTVTGNIIEGAHADCIALNVSENINITGNTLISCKNAAVRLQNTTNVTISSNNMKNDGGNHFIRNDDEDGVSYTKDVVIIGNIFYGNTNCAPVILQAGTSSQNDIKNIVISSNSFNDINTTDDLETCWTNTGYVVFVSGNPQNMSIVDNIFYNMTTSSDIKDQTISPFHARTGSSPSYTYYSYSIETRNNKYYYNDSTHMDTLTPEGSVRFNTDTNGDPDSKYYSGIINGITRTNTGEYTITFKKKIYISAFTWTASSGDETNYPSPKLIKMNVPNPGSLSAGYVNTIIVKTYNASFAQYSPRYVSILIEARGSKFDPNQQ